MLVLERRHVLGGAAVTEEVFPGFKFSVCSYVVSLLRPEIIRELDLPRHGMELLPLDGTLTPMPNGDYLWRVNDHYKTRREIARHSRLDAEAYDEYGKAMVEMGRFAKPILGMLPPDPTSLDPRGLLELLVDRQALPRHALPRSREPGAAADDERGGLSRSVVRDRRAQGDDVGVGDHRHVSRRAIAGHGLRAAPSLHGRDRRRLPLVGPVARRHRRGVERDRRRGARASAPRFAPRRRSRASSRRTAAPPASCSRTATSSRANVVVSSVDPNLTFLKFMDERELPADFVEGVRRYKYRGSSGKVNLALDALPDFTCMPGPGPAPARRHLDLAERRLHGARLRRCEVRAVFAAAVHRHGDSVADRSVGGAARQARDVVLRAVRAVSPEGRRVGRRQREAFGDAVIDAIAEYAPNIKDIILHRQVLTPLDIERDFGLTEGNIFQGELTLEQLFFLRPVPGWAQYSTPIDRLYMCGSATHPGGGIMGAPGKNAAERILKEVSR